MAKPLPPYVERTIEWLRTKQVEDRTRDKAMRAEFEKRCADTMFARTCVVAGVDPAGGCSPSLIASLTGAQPGTGDGECKSSQR
jgi:hypothetical protein